VVIAAPGERIKVLVMADAHAAVAAAAEDGGAPARRRAYRGPLDAARACVLDGGVRSLFRGTAATLARDAVGSAFYFTAYEQCGRLARALRGDAPDARASLLSVVTGASVAGMANWCAAMPLDVIKSRVQAGAPDAPRVSMADVARAVWAEGGWRGFYRGLAPALARSVPANIAAFSAIETARGILERYI
jgi:solute carrier family 25 carnitine/acylcarnitine transporter 20/29